jgi:predicted alpha/beta hydrolase family esterase
MSTEQATKEVAAYRLIPWAHTTPGAEGPQGFVPRNFESQVESRPSRGTIVVFHGNGGCAFERGEYVEAFTQRRFRTFLYEYPGYGGRPGTPSEKTIVPDGRSLIRSLDAAGYGPIYVWGESLGAGVAAAVCGDPTLPVHGLVLLTPWDNIANVGLSMYPYIPVRLLMIDKYDSIGNLEKFPHPICVVRSMDDEIIPPSLTSNLIANLPEPKKVIEHQHVGHNNWPNSAELKWWDEALDFIAPR